MADCPTIIVVAYSGRALASSARHAGFSPLSIDVFGDDDTREMCLASVKLDGGLSDGLMLDKVIGAVEMLISAHDPIGLVYGAGFEHQPETIAAFARRTRVFGNHAETLKRAKDPLALAQICEACGVRHPPIAFALPDEPELWLMKRRGGAGAPTSRRLTARAWLHRTVIINVALPEGASRGCSWRAKKGRNHWPQHAVDSANAGVAVSIWRRCRTRRHRLRASSGNRSLRGLDRFGTRSCRPQQR